jgi:ABC-type Na+ efflux pump permease subunit
MKGKIIGYIVLAALLVIVIAAVGYMSFSGNHKDARAAIEKTLVGTNLTYYSIAGKPMNYTITQDDIVSVEPITYKGKDAWKVLVGQSLTWNLTMSADGTQVLDSEQLFRT